MFLEKYKDLIESAVSFEDLESKMGGHDRVLEFYENLHSDVTDICNLPLLEDEDIILFEKAAWMIAKHDDLYYKFCCDAVTVKNMYNKYNGKPNFFKFEDDPSSNKDFQLVKKVLNKIEKGLENMSVKEQIEFVFDETLEDIIEKTMFAFSSVVHYNQEALETVKKLVNLLDEDDSDRKHFERGIHAIEKLLG